MRRVGGLIGLVLLWTTALSLMPSAGLGQQGGIGSPDDKLFSEGSELVQLDFKDVELAVVVETIARITGQNFIYDDRVRGRVTIVSPSEVTVDQAFAVFESVLKIKGFTAVPGPGGVLKIVPVRDAKESSIETIKDNRPSPNRDSFVTRLVPLLYIDAEAITNTIKPLVSKDASMVAYAPTNTIILTDTEANIRRLLSILEAIDVKTYKEELAVIKIKYADASTLGEQISEIYGAAVSSGAGPAAAARARRSASRRGSASPPVPGVSGTPESKVRIMTDERTNSLLVLASRTSLADIRELVRKLDVPLVGGGRIHVYYLNHADSEELASTLSSMLSGQSRSSPTPGRSGAAGGQVQNLRSQVTALAEGITLSPDPATNSLVIQASKEAYEALVAVIEQLDIPRPQVLVEALIIEVDVTDGIELGVQWAINAINGDQQFYFSTAQAAVGGGAGDLAGVITRNFDLAEGSNITPADRSTATGTNYDAVLKAAAKDTNLNIVSAPHILTSDNEEAEIRIGNNIPIITSRVNSATGNVGGLASSVNVERQDIGVTLRVTPQISEGNTLRLKIFQELTQINESLQSGVGTADEVGVALFNRKIENTVVVKDGETVVVGGLISDRWRDDEFKVPFLGDIPGLGWAFKTNTKELQKINLLVFLTPHIIRDAEEMEYETIRRRMEFEDSLGQTYQTDPNEAQELKKTDGVINKGINPAYDALRDHSGRYSPERREELERQFGEERRRAEEIAGVDANRSAYGLRVKLYDNESDATSALLDLLDAGYEGTLMSDNAGGRVVYELLTGPYTELKAAQAEAEVLTEVYQFNPVVTVVETTAEAETTSPETEKESAPEVEGLSWPQASPPSAE